MRIYKLFIPAIILLLFSGIVSAAETTYDLKIDVKHF